MATKKKKATIKKIAPLKNTSGEGIDYENSVVTYFLSFLLSNRTFEQSLGPIKKIDFQTRVDDNLLDDIILTCEQNHKSQRCFVSVKSNQQFSKNGAPIDFVFAAWNMYLHEVESCFDKNSDFLCLTSFNLTPTLSNDLNVLLKMASDQDSEDLLRRLPSRGYVNSTVRNIFKSFSCPREIASKHSISAKDIGNFLKSIKTFQFDFESIPSEKIISGLRNCQDVLWSQSPEDANSLWKELETISKRLRHAGGSTDIESLVSELKMNFRLKDYPVHHTDWVCLEKYSKDYVDGIRTKIGDKVTIQRIKEVSELNSEIANHKITFLLGSSGSGKTVLVKAWMDQFTNANKILWWDAGWFAQEDLSGIERRLKLTYPLSELFNAASGPQNVIIVDGVDRIFADSGFQRLSQLIRILKLDNTKSLWRIIFTCRIEEWKRIRDALTRHNIDLDGQLFTFSLPELSEVELGQVLEVFPTLKNLKNNRNIRLLLKKPKILDLLARHSTEIKNLAGESDFIEWYWEQEIQKSENSTTRSSFLQNFSARLADGWESDIAETDFPLAELPIIDELIRDHILKKYQYRISFFHDLYGDWARQRILIGKQKQVRIYIKEKCDSPPWHRAIQLYGLHLLERTKDSREWSILIHSLSDENETHSFAQDLILESIIFASDPLPLLEKVWPELSKDDGKLLKSLLIRFQYIATVPNPLVREKAREVGLDLTEAEMIARLPYWPYWIPLIRFLSNHEREVTKLDPKSIADLGYTWLQQTPESYPLRHEVANLVLSIAEDVRIKQKNKDHLGCNKELIKSAYSAAIASFREDPDRATKLLLDICERTVPGEQYHASHKKIIHSEIDGDSEYPAPWQDGPNERIDSDFIEICTEDSALTPLILFKPELAKEVCLAIMIEAPRPRSYDDSSFWDKEFGINTQARVYPAFYDKGPFLHFLRNNSKEGLELIIQLVNFATERWGELNKKDPGITHHVAIILSDDMSKEWIGNDTVYTWYRESLAPLLLTSALMALEKFLYEKIDSGESIEEYLETILTQSKSVAFGGLLITIGKYKPILFLGPLKPLFTVPEFFDWELGLDINPTETFSPGWLFRSHDQQIAAKSWDLLPHRKLSYKEIAIGAFIKSPEIQDFFNSVKLKWQNEIEHGSQDDQKKRFIRVLISWFDLSNYYSKIDEEKGRCIIYNPPLQIVTDFKEHEEPQIQEATNRLLLQTLIFTCNDLLKNRNKGEGFNPDTIWYKLSDISTNQKYDIHLDYLSRDDAICGGCAALLVTFPDYLKNNPDKEKWCKEQILNILNNPPHSQAYLDSEENPVDFGWDSFCAWALPRIWAENLQSLKIREFIVFLAMNYHYKTVEILFTSCGEVRDKLGDHFKELEHFILLWSAAKNRIKFSQLEGTTFDTDHWIDVNATKFIKGKLSANLSNLESIENQDNKIKLRFSHSHRGTRLQLLGFDLKTIELAFNWRSTQIKTFNKKERNEWINFIKVLLKFSLKQFGELSPGDEEYEGSPNEWDQWLFSCIAYNVAELQPHENPQELWLPILNLGQESHEWIEKFLFCWGMNFYYFKENPENFIREWKSMIDFAHSSPKWNYSEIKNRSDLDDMWCSLLGLDNISSDKWDNEQKKLVNIMFDSYQKCAPIILNRRQIAEKFIAFLTMPASEDLRNDGLVWLYNASIQVGPNYWNDRKMNEKLASLLNICWKYHSSKFSEKPDSFDAFKGLLKNLADRQVPLAYAILDNASKTRFTA